MHKWPCKWGLNFSKMDWPFNPKGRIIILKGRKNYCTKNYVRYRGARKTNGASKGNGMTQSWRLCHNWSECVTYGLFLHVKKGNLFTGKISHYWKHLKHSGKTALSDEENDKKREYRKKRKDLTTEMKPLCFFCGRKRLKYVNGEQKKSGWTWSNCWLP